MKRIAKITYPYTVLNTIEVDVSELDEHDIQVLEDTLREQVNLINDHVPGYENTDVVICRAAREVDMYSFKIIETE